MWQDLQDLHALGILVRDIHSRNYIEGKLVDFGRAWTMFHPCFDEGDIDSLQKEREMELEDLEGLILDYWDDERAGEDVDWPEVFQEAMGNMDKYTSRGGRRNYDWRKWEDDLVQAETFVSLDLYADKKEQV